MGIRSNRTEQIPVVVVERDCDFAFVPLGVRPVQVGVLLVSIQSILEVWLPLELKKKPTFSGGPFLFACKLYSPERFPGMIGRPGQCASLAGEVEERGAGKNFNRKDPRP